MKQFPIAALASLLISTTAHALAESNESQSAISKDPIFQDCILEGRVVSDKAEDGNNIVRIDFYKAQPYKPESRCIIDGSLEFKQPKGSLIENLSEGSVVQYHYIKTTKGKTSWQLIGAFI